MKSHGSNVGTVHELDCTGKRLGKVAQKAVQLVRGLDSVFYNPCLPKRNVLIKVRNVEKGLIDPYKKYHTHTRYKGGHRLTLARDLLLTRTRYMFKRICKGQLPKNKSCLRMLKYIHVY